MNVLKSLSIFLFLTWLPTLSLAEVPHVELDSWNQMQKACIDPGSIMRQVAPKNIEVNCSKEVLYWEMVASEIKEFPASGQVTMSVSSSKADVPTMTFSAKTSYTSVECPVVAQFRQVTTASFSTNCVVVNQYNTAAEFCSDRLNDTDYKLTPEEISGSRKSLCTSKE